MRGGGTQPVLRSIPARGPAARRRRLRALFHDERRAVARGHVPSHATTPPNGEPGGFARAATARAAAGVAREAGSQLAATTCTKTASLSRDGAALAAGRTHHPRALPLDSAPRARSNARCAPVDPHPPRARGYSRPRRAPRKEHRTRPALALSRSLRRRMRRRISATARPALERWKAMW